MSGEWIGQSLADRWHFLRYADPEQHLRWRIHGDPATLANRVWPAIHQATEEWLQRGQVWRVQLDTYDREVERYGGAEAMGHAESIFYQDSAAVVDLLALFEPGDAGLEERWRIALRGADQLLEDFGLSLPERLALLPRMAGYGSVASPSSGLRQQLSVKFREIRSSLEGLLDRSKDGTSDFGPGLEVLAERSSRLAAPIAALRGLAEQGRLAERLDTMAGSCIHMHLNRVLRDSPNAHETVIYDWLRRIYESRLAREKGRSTSG
jgi:thiopeptide-type bacteriocin biosynthesis protein